MYHELSVSGLNSCLGCNVQTGHSILSLIAASCFLPTCDNCFWHCWSNLDWRPHKSRSLDNDCKQRHRSHASELRKIFYSELKDWGNVLVHQYIPSTSHITGWNFVTMTDWCALCIGIDNIISSEKSPKLLPAGIPPFVGGFSIILLPWKKQSILSVINWNQFPFQLAH